MHAKTTSRLKVEYLPAETLIPNIRNPRKHSKKQIRQLMQSVSQFGFIVPVLVDEKQQVIAGHGRLLAAAELKMAEVPVIRLEHLTPAEAQAFLIADNKLTENAQWDAVLLGEHFAELASLELDFELDITGFELGEIDILIEGPAIAKAEPEEKPVPQGPAVTKPGDLWLLGKHRLYCGSSLEAESYRRLMEGKKAQLVFTDPPYNVPVNGHVSGLGKVQHREFAMAAGEMSAGQFTDFLQTVFQHLTQNSADGSIHYICMDWRHILELMDAAKDCYSEHKNICVWVKDNAGMGAFYRSQHEMVFVFKHGSAKHINNFELGQHGRYRSNVWNYAGINSFSRKTEEGNLLALHPTVKPVQLVADAILDCSKRNGIVLDAFLGSGSTLIAAEKTGRRCYGIELDPLYVDTAIRRWQQWTGENAVHTESGRNFNDLIAEMSNG